MYIGTVIRPPSEADSVIIQATLGCSHNRCAFCPTYLDKDFKEKPVEEILADIEIFKKHEPGARRVFLADGNALAMPFEKLDRILDALSAAFPRLQRVGIYANARDIERKTEKQLEALASKKLGIIYLGLESGSDEVLKRVKKGATSAGMVKAVKKAQAAGIKASVIGLIGLGGRELSEEHALKTAEAVNQMNPRFISFLTLMLVPGTPLFDEMESGKFQPLNPFEGLKELRLIAANLEITGQGTIFRSNHASNYLALAGTLPKDKNKILTLIDACLEGRLPTRPEWMRGL
jgi:radical SAM superfamily enzyme YgiQ (UPF0313 family)